MKAFVFALFTTAFFCSYTTAQTSISGSVFDGASKETVPGIGVLILETQQQQRTDIDGKYNFAAVPKGNYTLVFRADDTYKHDTVAVVVENAPVEVSVEMKVLETELGVVIIEHVRDLSNTAEFVIDQKNADVVRDGVDAKAIQAQGSSNGGDVAKKISGASVQDNRFVVVRGLSDRYNSAYINGAPLPSSESDRKAFALDIFPANMLDNMTITKTATPDMPGEFAGGVITLNTKAPGVKDDYQTLQLGGSLNTMTTFRNFNTYNGGSTDWLGVDNGARGLPGGLPDSKTYSTLTSRQKAEYAKLMTPSWGINSRIAMPSSNLQYGLGRKFELKNDRTLGMVVAYTYQNNLSTNETTRREFEEQATGVVQKTELKDTVYSQKVLNSGMLNLSYELNKRNKLVMHNMYSINSEDRVNIRKGVREMDSDPHQFEISSNRLFTENKLYTAQLEGNHEFAKEGMEFNWTGGFSDVNRSIPNQRRVVYQKSALTEDDTTEQYTAVIQNNGTIPTAAGNMFWSETKERIYSFSYGLSLPWEFASVKNVFKIGGFEQYRDRTFNARNFGFSRFKTSDIDFDNSLLLLPEDEIFAPEHLGLMENGKGGFKLEEATKVSDSYSASSLLHAGYLMFDTKVMRAARRSEDTTKREKIRFVGGVRIESYEQVFNYTEAGSNIDHHIDTTVVDFLPSINAIYALNRKMNFRASYYRTVSRPEFRELAPFAFYNFALDNILSGNPNLKRATIDNFDLRYEYFPGNGQLFTVSAFYKDFTNPIELINRTGVSGAGELYYANVPRVVNYGIETEYRVKLDIFSENKEQPILSNTTLYTNFALIQSKVDVSKITGAIGTSRPLQGQSPYIVNAGLQYENPDKNWGMNLSYNIVGRRIFIVGNVQEPDVWEMGRNVIDFQFSKTFNDRISVRVNVRDLLAQKQLFYQDLNMNRRFDEGTDNRWQETKFGQSVSFSINYKFGAVAPTK